MPGVIYATLAMNSYSSAPTFGDEDSSSRCVVTDGVLAFPGTNNIATAISDVDILPVKTSIGELHKGFYDAAMALFFRANQYQSPVLVGHSEGAAIAIILGAAMVQAGNPPSAVWAFEPPRVTTDGRVFSIMRDNSVKVVLTRNGNDIVTDIPFQIPGGPKWVQGDLTHIGSPSLPIPNIEDHEISKVVEAMKGFSNGTLV